MKPEEQLDCVLSYLDNDKTAPETEQQILDGLKDFKPTFKELYLILHKLCKDGYADYLLAKKGGVPDPETKCYFITFHGKLFLEQRGYQQQLIDDRNAKVLTEAALKRNERNEERLVLWTRNLFWGTVAVAVGAVGLVIWEMWHYFHSCE